MAATSTCPKSTELQRLATGELPPADMEAVVLHLESCDSCLAKVQALSATDTLMETLARAHTLADGPEEPVVTRLIARLKDLGKTQAPAVQEQKTVLPDAPKDLSDLKTVLPVGEDTGTDALKKASPDVTQGLPAKDDVESELWDFLAPAEMPDEIGRLGPYRVLKVLGAGGMGVVFRAEDPELKRFVAIKAMLPALAASPSAKMRFKREAQAAAALKHDHIVAIYQVSEDRGAPYIAMEFLDGEPLDKCLERDGKLPLLDTLRIGREIAEGLDAAHDKGLIHRDIKPANVWLETRSGRQKGRKGEGETGRKGEGETGRKGEETGPGSISRSPILPFSPSTALPPRVKILDFGLARAADGNSALTQQGAIIGTPAYMAPEQGRGENVDARCDLFSLGVVLYRMCTGQAPFHGNDTVSTLMSVAMHDPTPPIQLDAALPQELSDLVMKLLEKNPADRTASAGEVVHALQTMEKDLTRQRESRENTVALRAASSPSGKGAAPVLPSPSGRGVAPVLPSPSGRGAAPVLPSPSGRGAGGEGVGRVPPRSRRTLLISTAFAFLALLAASIVFYWQTNNGIVRIEIDDPEIQVVFGKEVLTFKGADKEHEIKVSAGQHMLHVKRGKDFEFDTDKFILKRGETVTLKIEWFKEGKLQVVQGDKVIGKALATVDGPPISGGAASFALRFDRNGAVQVNSKVGPKHDSFTLEGWFWMDPNRPKNKNTAAMFLITTDSIFGVDYGATDRYYHTKTNQARNLVSNETSGKEWTHAAVVQQGGESMIFVNGQLAGRKKSDAVLSQIVGLGNVSLRGSMKEVRISKTARYDKDFTPAKRFEPDADTLALYHFDEGSGDELKDSSGNGHHGKIVGAKWVNADGTPIVPQPNLALDLQDNGTVEVPTLNLSKIGDLTVEARVLVEAVGLKKNAAPFLMGEPGAASFRLQRNKNEIQLGRNSASAVPIPVPKRWVHIAAVRSGGGKATFFLDGKNVGELKKGGGKAKLDAQLEKEFFRIGDADGNCYATVDEVRVSKTARYTADFIPAQRFEPDADTLALYHCDEGSGDVLKDSSGNGHHGKIVGAKWVKVDGTAIAPPPDLALDLQDEGMVEVPSLKLNEIASMTLEARVLLDPQPQKDLPTPFLLGQMGSGSFRVDRIRKEIRMGKGAVSAPIPLPKRWVHIATVREGTVTSFFLDGKKIGDAKGKAKQEADAEKFFRISGSRFAAVDEVRVSKVVRYTTDFTPAKRFELDNDTIALYHCDEGAGTKFIDATGKHHGTITGCKWVKVDELSPPLPSVLLLAAGNSVKVPTLAMDSNSANKPLTLEAYVTPWKDQSHKIVGFGNVLHLDAVGGSTAKKLQNGWFLVQGFGKNIRVGPAPVVVKRRVHLAGVYDGGQYRLYVDGKLIDGTKKNNTPAKWLDKGDAGLFIGDGFDGVIEEVRISKIARYNTDFTPKPRFEPDADTLALYHGDEGSGDVLKDSSGNGHHGKIVGAKWVNADATSIPILPNLDRMALRFDGQSNVVLPRANEMKFTEADDFTVEARVFPEATQKNAACVFHIQNRLSLHHDGMDAWKFGYSHGGNITGNVKAPFAVEKKSTHIAGVRSGRKLLLFVHGKLVGSTDMSQSLLESALNFLTIGGGFVGRIEEFRISKVARYDKNFTPAQRFEADAYTLALYHCDEGAGDVLKDSSGNGHHGKIVGAKWVKVDGAPVLPLASHAALRFENTNSVQIPTLVAPTEGSLTLEAYVIPMEQKFTTGGHILVDANGRFDLRITGNRVNQTWGFFTHQDSQSSTLKPINGHPPVVFGKRIHLAGVRDAKNNRLFVDGVLVADSGGRSPKANDKTLTFTLGGQAFVGIIDEVRISKVARYDKDFTPQKRFEPDADTLALYHFDEGAGDELKDSSGNGHHGKIVEAKWVKVEEAAISLPPPPPNLALDLQTSGGVDAPSLKFGEIGDLTLEARVLLDPVPAKFFPTPILLGQQGHTVFHVDRDKKEIYVQGRGTKYLNAPLPLPKRWLHVAAVHTAKRLVFFMDGKKIGDFPAVAPDPDSTKSFRIAGGKFIRYAVVDEIRVSKGARYEQDFVPPLRFEPDPDTVALYHCDEGQGDKLIDAMGKHHGTITGCKWVKGDGTALSAAPNDDAWLKQVATMSGAQQVEAVKAELMKRNPGFDGKMLHVPHNDGYTGFLSLKDAKLTDIAPLRGLNKILVLDLDHTQVADLSALKDLHIERLGLLKTQVTDLTPLQNLPIEELTFEIDLDRDGPVLRSISTLKKINGKDAKDVLK